VVLFGEQEYPIAVRPIDGGHRVSYGGVDYEVLADWSFYDPVFRCTINRQPVVMQVERIGTRFRIRHWGVRAEAEVVSARGAELLKRMPKKAPPDLSKFLLSPMPGLLREVAVKAGQEVKAGEKLAVIEAMKMENVLKAEQDCVVDEVLAKQGESLAVDQPIVRFK
jgi:propionyl-CoA carboxylase alpha chain